MRLNALAPLDALNASTPAATQGAVGAYGVSSALSMAAGIAPVRVRVGADNVRAGVPGSPGKQLLRGTAGRLVFDATGSDDLVRGATIAIRMAALLHWPLARMLRPEPALKLLGCSRCASFSLKEFGGVVDRHGLQQPALDQLFIVAHAVAAMSLGVIQGLVGLAQRGHR